MRWFRRPEESQATVVPSPNLIVWSDRGRLRAHASRVESAGRITIGDRVFRPCGHWPESGVQWCNLLDPRDRGVVGFEITPLSPGEPILESPLVTRTKGVHYDGIGCLDLVVREVESPEFQCKLGFPVEFFEDEAGDFLVWFGCIDTWIDPPGLGYPVEDGPEPALTDRS